MEILDEILALGDIDSLGDTLALGETLVLVITPGIARSSPLVTVPVRSVMNITPAASPPASVPL